MSTDASPTAEFDERSARALAERGLEARVIAPDDRDGLRAWSVAVTRGFLGGEQEADVVERGLDDARPRRVVGVYDPAGADPATPVATVDSWIGELTLPGGSVLPSWAVSAVTVAPTHGGRGIARAMLEDQLRTAARLGLPMAMLTVSESQLYGRYGFAPAAFAAELALDTWRVDWVGPDPRGRLDFITVQQWSERIGPLNDRVRRQRAGDVDVWPQLWPRFAGLVGENGAEAKKRRAVQYTDEAGELRGLLLYATKGDELGFTEHTLEIVRLEAETPDAYAALWRYAVRHPLVRRVTSELASIDEPVRWMISDMRALQQKVFEHQYLRVLDAEAVLAARGIEWEGAFADPLGIAGPADASGPTVRDLASAYLGAPGTRGLPPELADRLGTAETPFLGIWY